MKYLLVPGWMTRADDSRYYVSAVQLAELYGVPLTECVIETEDGHQRFQAGTDGPLVWLVPKQNGNYEVPNEG